MSAWGWGGGTVEPERKPAESEPVEAGAEPDLDMWPEPDLEMWRWWHWLLLALIAFLLWVLPFVLYGSNQGS